MLCLSNRKSSNLALKDMRVRPGAKRGSNVNNQLVNWFNINENCR